MKKSTTQKEIELDKKVERSGGKGKFFIFSPLFVDERVSTSQKAKKKTQ